MRPGDKDNLRNAIRDCKRWVNSEPRADWFILGALFLVALEIILFIDIFGA